MNPHQCEPQTRRFATYAVLSAALLAGALLASGLYSIYLLYSNSVEQVLALQQDKADFAAQRIEQFLEEIEKQMVWTMLPYGTRGDVSTEQRRFELYKLLMRTPAIDEISWIDHAGRLHVKAS
jgi:CHASE1-domain containing sensor protein